MFHCGQRATQADHTQTSSLASFSLVYTAADPSKFQASVPQVYGLRESVRPSETSGTNSKQDSADLMGTRSPFLGSPEAA